MMRAGVRALVVSAVLAGVLAVGATPAAATTGVTVAGGNGFGSGAHQLGSPYGVAVDSARYVYAVDYNNHRVQRWARGATQGVTVAGGNGAGSSLNQLAFPTAAVVDSAGNLYVSDSGNSRVLRFAPGSTQGVLVAGGNGAGGAANQLQEPYGLAIDSAGRLYIADRNNNRIQRWDPGATQGVTVAGGLVAGSGPSQLDNPHGVALDPSGRIYVGDTANHRVQRWAPGANQGVTVAGGNGPGSGANQLSQPAGVGVDRAGFLYVVDTANHRVQRLAPGVNQGVTVAGGNGDGAGADQLDLPFGLSLDAAGNVYVADSQNFRVQRWPAVRPSPLPNAGFPDVQGGLYYSVPVNWAAWTSVTTGYGSTGRFEPDIGVSRGQMVTFLHRLMDTPGGHPAHGFPDAPPATFYESALRWAKATGVTTGYGSTGRFEPDIVVTRGQMVTFLHRVAGSPGGHPAHGFPDVPPGTFYESALRWAKATGVTTGYGSTGRFEPDIDVSRAQMVTFLYRLASTDPAWRVGATIPSTVLF